MTGSGFNFGEYENPAPGQPYGSGPSPQSDDPAGYGGFGSGTDPFSSSAGDPGRSGLGTVDYAFGPPAVDLSTSLQLGKPPVLWLVACAVVAVGAGVVAWLLGESLLWAIVAWVASGPVAIGLLAAFNVFDTRARTRTYAQSGRSARST